MCSNKTWNEIFYVIWNITVRGHSCRISSSNDGQKSVNTCKDGKSLQNTSRVQPYLHIPNFSADDVGLYMCESPYNGGSENYNINVSITGKTSFWRKTKKASGSDIAKIKTNITNYTILRSARLLAPSEELRHVYHLSI